ARWLEARLVGREHVVDQRVADADDGGRQTGSSVVRGEAVEGAAVESRVDRHPLADMQVERRRCLAVDDEFVDTAGPWQSSLPDERSGHRAIELGVTGRE